MRHPHTLVSKLFGSLRLSAAIYAEWPPPPNAWKNTTIGIHVSDIVTEL